MSSNITTNNINPKFCSYGCGLQIYWNTSSTNEYWELYTKKKHICPNSATNKKRNYDLFDWINIPDYVIS